MPPILPEPADLPELAYELAGDQPGPPVVLLHAFPLDRTMWRGVAERLPRRSVLVDLPGMGASPLPGPDRTPSLDISADAVAALLDRLGEPAAVLAGVSMGGYVAMAFARRHPRRLLGLALIDTKAEADTAQAAANRERMATAVTGEQGIAALEAALPPLLGRSSQQRDPTLAAAVRRRALSARPEGVAWSQRAMAARPDSTASLAGVQVPSLVLVGEEDGLITAAQSQALAATLPDSVFLEVRAAGHLSPLERPQAVADALARALLRVNPGPDAGSPPRG